jgi:hypothetical protein
MGAALEVGNAMSAARAVVFAVLFASLLLSAAAQAKHYALIVSGLGGEAEYEERFQSQANELAKALQHASDSAQIEMLTGAQATRAAIAQKLQSWTALTSPADQITITLIGHGNFDGEDYRYNVPGPDVTAGELARWLNAVPGKQLVVVTTSASGAALAKLTSGNRVVVTATKSGGERNAPQFAAHWVSALSSSEADIDKNEWVTAQEAFDFAVRKVADTFKSNAALATEHARLEGKHAATIPLGRLGSMKEMVSDTELVQLFAERVRIEGEFDAAKARKSELEDEAYYSQLEKTLVALARTQRRIDSRQAALQKESAR